MASILLITPDRSFEDYAMQVLSTAGHQIIRVGNAEEAARAALTLPVDVVVADSLAPDLPAARERLEATGRHVAFVFVSPSTTQWAGVPLRDGDRLVQKPASSGELRAAVAELLRASEVMGNQLDLCGVTFDRVGQRLRRGAEVAQLTLTESHLLDYLASVRGTIASSAELLDHVWHYTGGTASSEVVRSHLKNLRHKIRAVNEGRDLIETIPRRGYRLVIG
jgi:DNA-binding response OmpR family regulator